MYLAYLDESGDPGLVRSPTTFFVLSCVLVHDSRWLETLDGLIRDAAAPQGQVRYPADGGDQGQPELWGNPPGIIKEELTRIIEDPNERASHLSYFSQLADWNAYAAHKSQYIAPAAPFPADAWDQLGRVLLRAVNQNTGGPPGIVRWPRPAAPGP